MRARTLLSLLFLLGALIAPANGVTDRFYHDRDETSADGTLRLTAVSPDNQGKEWHRPFADDFVYTLTDVATGDVVWERRQPDDEASPIGVWVHDEGWVVVRTAHSSLLFLDPANGMVRWSLDILDQFGNAERRRHVLRSTAGPIWATHADFGFEEIEDRLHFVLRTGWDRRIVADLEGGAVIADDHAVQHTLDAMKIENALDHLAYIASAPDTLRDPREWRQYYETVRSMCIVAENGLEEAIPDLRTLEAFEPRRFRGTIALEDFELGPNDGIEIEGIEVRLAAQAALRHLGEMPASVACTDLFLDHSEHPRLRIVVPALTEPRHERVKLVDEGDTIHKVLLAIGPPDYESRAEGWIWHIDDPDPYTLGIRFDDQHRAKSIEIVRTQVRWDLGDWFEHVRFP